MLSMYPFFTQEWMKGSHADDEFILLNSLNMAEIAGMSRQRDTSSYYQGPRKGMKFRPWEYVRPPWAFGVIMDDLECMS